MILLGDGLHDLDMIKGFDYDEMISIGFQNSVDTETTARYSSQFNMVLEGDTGFEGVNRLVGKLE